MLANTVTIAHLSDVHLGPLLPVPLPLLNAKRAAGALNWLHKRRYIHLPAVADLLARDVTLLKADHIAVTGDLTNLGLATEVVRASHWLRHLGTPDMVSVVPGNHDIYSAVHGRRLGVAALAPWAAHFTSCALGVRYTSDSPFPFVRILTRGATRVALIGLNSAVETPPLIATGELGAGQLQGLANVLHATGRDGYVRVVLIHHPPLPGLASTHHELTDAGRLADILRDPGAELILHGHNHRRMINTGTTTHGRFLSVGVPSASAGLSRRGEPLARAHIFQITQLATTGAAHISMTARGLVAPDGGIVEIERQILHPTTT